MSRYYKLFNKSHGGLFDNEINLCINTGGSKSKKNIRKSKKMLKIKKQIGGHNDARVIYDADNNNIIITKTITCCGNEGHLDDIQSKSKAQKYAPPILNINDAYKRNLKAKADWNTARTELDMALHLERPINNTYDQIYYNAITLHIIPIFTVYNNPILITKMALATKGMIVFGKNSVDASLLDTIVKIDAENEYKLYKIYRVLIHLTAVHTFFKDLYFGNSYLENCEFVIELNQFLGYAWLGNGYGQDKQIKIKNKHFNILEMFFNFALSGSFRKLTPLKIIKQIEKYWIMLMTDGIFYRFDHEPMRLHEFIVYLNGRYNLDERILLPALDYL